MAFFLYHRVGWRCQASLRRWLRRGALLWRNRGRAAPVRRGSDHPPCPNRSVWRCPPTVRHAEELGRMGWIRSERTGGGHRDEHRAGAAVAARAWPGTGLYLVTGYRRWKQHRVTPSCLRVAAGTTWIERKAPTTDPARRRADGTRAGSRRPYRPDVIFGGSTPKRIAAPRSPSSFKPGRP